MAEADSLPQDQKNIITRRQLLKAAGTAAVVGGLGYWQRYPIAERIGTTIDEVLETQNRGPAEVIALPPRISDIPKISPGPELPDQSLTLSFKSEKDKPVIAIDEMQGLTIEHTQARVTGGTYTEAGQAVITTAEGLALGEQQFCALFTHQDTPGQAIALGYDGGAYAYSTQLGEWTRILQPGESGLTRARIGKAWEEIPPCPGAMIDKIATGNQTLRDLGYEPFGAIKAETRMPEMSQKPISPEEISRTKEDAVEGKYHYMITKEGGITDLVHIGGTAEKTLYVYLQTVYHSIAAPSENTRVSIAHGIANNAAVDEYIYQLDPADVKTKDPLDFTYQVMQDWSLRLEGITQRIVTENLPERVNKALAVGGMGAEDMFSNTLGIVYMIQQLREKGYDKIITEQMKKLYADKKLSDATTASHALPPDQVAELIKDILGAVVDRYGIAPVPQTSIENVPLGTSQYIPIQLSGFQGEIPRLPLDGIDLERSNYSFTPLKIPAVSNNLSRAVEKVDEKIWSGK